MNQWEFTRLLGATGGQVSPDAYNTAWAALVPSRGEPSRPAWPQTLDYLRRSQLPDGGWGARHVYYAHERTISTLGALWALLRWGEPVDGRLVERAISALWAYAAHLPAEPHEPIGFELLLPRLAVEVERFNVPLPHQAWESVERMAAQKMALIGQLQPDYERPRSWWFSMEMLLEYQLARFDERLLNQHGAVAISPAATAAYLRALRLDGRDSSRAADFLDHVLRLSGGGAGVCYPIEGFETIWTLDNYMRAGLPPDHAALAPLVNWLADYWDCSPGGLSFSQGFPIGDGDDTAVGYSVLSWAGKQLTDDALLKYWDSERHYFYTYADERTPSVSVNIHALDAFRRHPAHIQKAGHIVDWLREHVDADGKLSDKWHASPLYATTRVIPPLLGLDDDLARRCTQYVLNTQNLDGGWGTDGRSNLEETSLAVLGLVAARRGSLLEETAGLRGAAAYLARHAHTDPAEKLWIGKALYQPTGVVRSLVRAARIALGIENITPQPWRNGRSLHRRRPLTVRPAFAAD